MNLSKAQQEVVDKMREGRSLDMLGNFSPLLRLRKSGQSLKVKSSTFHSLRVKEVIFLHKTDGYTKFHQLTEKYRNNEG